MPGPELPGAARGVKSDLVIARRSAEKDVSTRLTAAENLLQHLKQLPGAELL